MILKMNNKADDFYQYLGKFFGSRIVETQTNDRMYDDANKYWYIYVEHNKVLAFVSIAKDKIKNIYGINYDAINSILMRIREETNITSSIVPNCYVKNYKDCGFKVIIGSHRNFVTISAKQKIEYLEE